MNKCPQNGDFGVFSRGRVRGFSGLPDEEFRESSGPIPAQFGYDFLAKVRVL
jgi:hypothetical protein